MTTESSGGKSGRRRRGKRREEISFEASVLAHLAETWRGKEKGPLSASLAGALRELILDGTFAAGGSFPNENVMCGLIGVGRGCLREAYQVLSLQGLISRSKSGTTVNGGALPWDDVLPGVSGRVDFHAVQEFRTMLEVETAKLAAERAEAEDIEKLASDITSMENKLDDCFLLTRYDTLFHMHMAEASKNILVFNTIRGSKTAMNDEILHIFDSDYEIRLRAIDFHRNILNAVLQKNSVAAGFIMGEHMLDVTLTLRHLLRQKR